jgi:inner membrane protein
VAALFLLADFGDQLTGGDAVLTSGPLDEIAHVLTALMVLWAIGGVAWDRLLVPALIISVAIDLDHLPKDLGQTWLTAGTPRPYTHSLLTIAVLLSGAWLWRRHRAVLLGLTLGLTIHFWRDTAEPNSGVALLWPVSNHSFSTPHVAYLALMALAFGVGMWRSVRESRASGARRRTPSRGEPERGAQPGPRSHQADPAGA